MTYFYVASSWRNEYLHRGVVEVIRAAGHEVYDFRNPRPGDNGFHWSEIDPDWKNWSPRTFRASLEHPIAVAGLNSDVSALRIADAVILVMPCGRSAHLELGYAIGAGKKTAILLSDGEPELMYGMADRVLVDIDDVSTWAEDVSGQS